MKEFIIISVGKLKEKNILELERDYLLRIQNPTLKIVEVKSHAEDLLAEGKEVMKTLALLGKEGAVQPILLAEKGQLHKDSQHFSQWLFEQMASYDRLAFIIGGASGHSPELYKESHGLLSLSPLTFPHKLARLLLIEQLYRAQSIKSNHPYHK